MGQERTLAAVQKLAVMLMDDASSGRACAGAVDLVVEAVIPTPDGQAVICN
jgi:hypothetical protein